MSLLIDEVERRTQIRWSLSPTWPKTGTTPVIAVGRTTNLLRDFPTPANWLTNDPALAGAEGYRIHSADGKLPIFVVGNDSRGVLYGVGRLLRELRMGRDRVMLPAGFSEKSVPQISLRGHQLGYRAKTNAYDGWDLRQWEQYYRDLVVFGANAIELIPPRSDDDADSPHFPRPPMNMMVDMSRVADEYGLDVWIWYPAMDEDYNKPATVEFALKEWEEVYKRLPRIDSLFVPAGDPGHTHPKPLMALLEKQSALLRKYHPKAQVWIAPQGFGKEWLDEFLEIMKTEPKWLDGIVFGPQIFIGLTELRKVIPSRYPIRGYPDITHTLNAQHPVHNWDAAFSLTQDREVVNPRPLAQAAVFRAYQPSTVGFLTYSEGCNDDVNKCVWSGLGWNPKQPVDETLRQYSRYYISDTFADSFAQGLLALERNWQGPLLTNGNVETTLLQFQKMEQAATVADLQNWRFQQALYRAYYDAFLRDRLIAETAQQEEAYGVLRQAKRLGSLVAIDQAHAILSKATLRPASEDRRTRVNELAEALFQSIHMQLSTEKYKGQPRRGTSQDAIDRPLNDRVSLEVKFESWRKLSTEDERLRAINEQLNRTDPGPGGFYDDLGDMARQPHLVPGIGFDEDPDFRRSSFIGYDHRPGTPMAWCHYAQSMYDAPLHMYYQGLDRSASYQLRVVYFNDTVGMKIRLDTEGKEIHGLIKKPDPSSPLEFDIPAAVTADGDLKLSWYREPGRGGSGRGCQVSEVWLIRKPPAEAAKK